MIRLNLLITNFIRSINQCLCGTKYFLKMRKKTLSNKDVFYLKKTKWMSTNSFAPIWKTKKNNLESKFWMIFLPIVEFLKIRLTRLWWRICNNLISLQRFKNWRNILKKQHLTLIMITHLSNLEWISIGKKH